MPVYVKLRLFNVDMYNRKYNYVSTHVFLLWFIQVLVQCIWWGGICVLTNFITIAAKVGAAHTIAKAGAPLSFTTSWKYVFLCKFLKMENFKIHFIYQYVQDLFYYFPVVSLSSLTPHTKCIPLLMSLEVPRFRIS